MAGEEAKTRGQLRAGRFSSWPGAIPEVYTTVLRHLEAIVSQASEVLAVKKMPRLAELVPVEELGMDRTIKSLLEGPGSGRQLRLWDAPFEGQAPRPEDGEGELGDVSEELLEEEKKETKVVARELPEEQRKETKVASEELPEEQRRESKAVSEELLEEEGASTGRMETKERGGCWRP